MNIDNKIVLFLVDDDALFLKSLEIEFLSKSDYVIKTYATGELCLSNLFQKPDLIVLDYHLNGIDKNAIDGLETLAKIKAIDSSIPVIMLSAQDKIDIAINCMHRKASDYIVKSETAFMRLQASMNNIFKYQQMEKELGWYMDRM